MSQDKKSEFDNTETLDKFSKSIESKSNKQLIDELSALELEEKQLDLEIKREKVASIKSKRSALLEEARAKTMSTLQLLAQRKATQDNCNHRKGGIGADAVMRGRGTDAMYAVFKHTLPDSRMYVLCSRCGREWTSPLKILGLEGTPGWRDAVDFPTDNTPSGSSRFMYDRTEDLAEQRGA